MPTAKTASSRSIRARPTTPPPSAASADEDVTGVREWSKAEIARIREETEQRIADRKAHLDRELEGHAAVVEREIEIVQEQVASFEGEMDGFFSGLVSEEDPGRFAALAASLPEPPPFRGIDPSRARGDRRPRHRRPEPVAERRRRTPPEPEAAIARARGRGGGSRRR